MRTLDTIGALADGYELHGWCACGHAAPIDLAALVARYGPDLPVVELVERLRCTSCRKRRAELRITATARTVAGTMAGKSPAGR